MEKEFEKLNPVYVGQRTRKKIFRNTIAITITFAIICLLIALFFIVAAFFVDKALQNDMLKVFIPIIAISLVISILLFLIWFLCKKKFVQNKNNQNPAIEVFGDEIILYHANGSEEKIKKEDIVDIKGQSFKYFVFIVVYVFYGCENYGKVVFTLKTRNGEEVEKIVNYVHEPEVAAANIKKIIF